MDTPASPPIETVEISRLFSPTSPRRSDEAVPHVVSLTFAREGAG